MVRKQNSKPMIYWIIAVLIFLLAIYSVKFIIKNPQLAPYFKSSPAPTPTANILDAYLEKETCHCKTSTADVKCQEGYETSVNIVTACPQEGICSEKTCEYKVWCFKNDGIPRRTGPSGYQVGGVRQGTCFNTWG